MISLSHSQHLRRSGRPLRFLLRTMCYRLTPFYGSHDRFPVLAMIACCLFVYQDSRDVHYHTKSFRDLCCWPCLRRKTLRQRTLRISDERATTHQPTAATSWARGVVLESQAPRVAWKNHGLLPSRNHATVPKTMSTRESENGVGSHHKPVNRSVYSGHKQKVGAETRNHGLAGWGVPFQEGKGEIV